MKLNDDFPESAHIARFMSDTPFMDDLARRLESGEVSDEEVDQEIRFFLLQILQQGEDQNLAMHRRRTEMASADFMN